MKSISEKRGQKNRCMKKDAKKLQRLPHTYYLGELLNLRLMARTISLLYSIFLTITQLNGYFCCCVLFLVLVCLDLGPQLKVSLRRLKARNYVFQFTLIVKMRLL